ncbi:MAG TPA: hypothetical protein PLZ93_12395, partial [Nocardioides sp.]|nr:hypothetical protein [Nocardioides sp.]
MGRFHRHDGEHDHEHPHDHEHHEHHEVGDLSGYATGADRVVVLERIFTENDRAADANRAALDAAGVRCVNLMSSPGAGKTALLERTLAHLAAADHSHVRRPLLPDDPTGGFMQLLPIILMFV